MSNRIRNLTLGLGLLFIIGAGFTVMETYAQTVGGGTLIRVAANLPLSGALATYGAAVREGATFALERTKPEGGHDLTFDWQDNAGDPKNAVTIMQRQFLQDPSIYVSGVKPQTMAIINQVTTRGLPHFVWIFDPVINLNSHNNFRTWVSYKIEPPVYLDYVKKRAAKRVSILYVQLPHTIESRGQVILRPKSRTQAKIIASSKDQITMAGLALPVARVASAEPRSESPPNDKSRSQGRADVEANYRKNICSDG